MTNPRTYLALADGTVFEGISCGASGLATGEVVFTTGATGYQEVLTDPSYAGQLVTMTSPHIGNVGVNHDDHEGRGAKPQASGLVIRDLARTTSNSRATQSLAGWLEASGTVAITEVDTRALTRHLRDHGAQNGAVGTLSPDDLVAAARRVPRMEGLDLVSRVTPTEAYLFSPTDQAARSFRVGPPRAFETERHIVAIDYGAKRNILRCLTDLGARVTVVPAHETADCILARRPDGIFLSNGPGDPAALPAAVATVRALLGKVPLFGICLGHQLLALATDARTFKLPFGHRGLNQPVIENTTGRVLITSQNHGFAVDEASLRGRAIITHRHLDDGTNEGLAIPDARAFSVQFHPEAAAGTHDALPLFTRFAGLVEGRAVV